MAKATGAHIPTAKKWHHDKPPAKGILTKIPEQTICWECWPLASLLSGSLFSQSSRASNYWNAVGMCWTNQLTPWGLVVRPHYYHGQAQEIKSSKAGLFLVKCTAESASSFVWREFEKLNIIRRRKKMLDYSGNNEKSSNRSGEGRRTLTMWRGVEATTGTEKKSTGRKYMG